MILVYQLGSYSIHLNEMLPFFTVEQIIFTRDLQDVKVTEFPSDAALECEISKDGLKVQWLKGKKEIRRDDKHDIIVEGKVHKLMISKVTTEDAGEYSATYQNLSTSAKLTVAVPPVIDMKNLQDRLVLKAGSSAAVEVPFMASPQPEVSWKFKGGKLPDSRRFKVDTIINMTSMAMAKVTRSDAGKYTLNIENPYGKATFTMELVVLGEQKLSMLNYMHHQLMYHQFNRHGLQ